MINLPVKFIIGNFDYFLGRLNSVLYEEASAPQLFVLTILNFVRTFCVELTIFNRFKAFCRPVGKGALRATFPAGSLKQQDHFIMNASSLMNINTDKKSIKKRVLWVVSISFVDLCCLVRQTQFFPV